ncbi:hypothetical protein LL251_17165 [Sphingobium naphthae]|nr:hypothetical protein [Sphingobium naphthae]
MAQAKVAIRLGTEGKSEVTRDFQEVGAAGDAAANRAARAFDRASQDMESAMRRQAAAAQKLAAITPQTDMQARISKAVGAGSSLGEGSARASAAAFRELLVEQERYQRSATQVVRSSGAMRAGIQQVGFQAQDFAVQIIGGTDAVRAFAMQAPQAIGALQLMSNGAQSGGGKFARFASILSGPVGVAIGVAIPLAVMLGEKFWGAGEQADAAANKVDRLGTALKRLRDEQANQGDIGEVLKKVNDLRDQRMNPSVRRARGESTDSYNRRVAAATAGLDAQIKDLEQQIAWNEVAQRGRRDASAYKPTPAARSGAPRSSGSSQSTRVAGRSPEEDTLHSLRVTTENNGWLNEQTIGGGARDALEKEGAQLAENQKLIAQIRTDTAAGTALLNLEWQLRGQSRDVTADTLELEKYRLDLISRYPSLTAEQVDELVKAQGAQIEMNRMMQEYGRSWQEVRRYGENAIAGLFDIRSAESWGSRVKNIVADIINDLIRAQMMKLLLGNNDSNGSESGGLVGSLFTAAASLFKGGSAIGHEYTPAGAMLVGENGPEVVQMPRGAKVMTASDTRRAMGNAPPVTLSPVYHIDATGADAAALNRAVAAIEKLNAEFDQRAVQTIMEAQERLILRPGY